ncbi:MAG: DUF262 domain-containing HNH endonuclease family protein [Thermoplasmata archaeon]
MIEPRYATLQSLFGDRVFRIPEYQRYYSWEKRQRDDLFGDIEQLAKGVADSHHFMATIVCYRTKEVVSVGQNEYRVHDIVDGQQRITTLIILLKCIERSLPPDSDDQKELAKVLVKRDGNILLLQSNNANQAIFDHFLRTGSDPSRADIVTRADRTFAAGIRECKGFVKQWQEQHGDVLSLLRLIKNRLGFVVYDTEDSRLVYSLFEVLNSRGLAVDWLDKCKSVLMGKAFGLAGSPDAAAAAIQTLQSIWGDIYRRMADASVDGEEILRVAAALYYSPPRGKPPRADEAMDVLAERCTAFEEPMNIGHNLRDVASKLVELDKDVFLGPATKILQARILAVSIQSAPTLSEREKEAALSQWERIAIRTYGLCAKDARTQVGDYLRLSRDIVSGAAEAATSDKIMDRLRELGSQYGIEEAIKEGLDGKPIYPDNPDLARYILWRYEEWLAREAGVGATVDEQVRQAIWNLRAGDSLEHIFPQQPEANGPWDGKMKRTASDPDASLNNVHRIGNLLLLPLPLNQEAQRAGFAVKREIYARHHLRMVDEVLKASDWNLSEIDRREQKIIAFARREWADL